MELQKEQISYNIPLLKKSVSLSSGGDFIVPDTKPDMEEILRTTATIRLTGVDTTKGRLTLRGCADFTVLYRPDGEPTSIKSIGTTFPFSHTEEHPDIKSDTLVIVSLNKESVSGRIQNSRKLSVGTSFNLSFSCEKEASFSQVTEIIGEDSKAEYLKSTMDTLYPVLCCDTEFYLEETLEVPGANPPCTEIHSMDISFSAPDMKLIQNKIVWKGTAHIVTLYSSEDESMPVATMEHEVPFTEILDIDGIREGMTVSLTPTVADISYHPENEKSLTIKAKVCAEITARETRSLSMITDAYAPRKKFTGEMNALSLSLPVDWRRETFSHRENISLDESEPSIARILDCRVTPYLLRSTPMDGYIDLEGKLFISLLYVTEEGMVCPLTRELSFAHRLDVPASKPNLTLNLSLSPDHNAYTMMSHDEIEIRLLLGAEFLLTEEKKVPCLTDAREEDAPPVDRPSIMICFAEDNDSLWKIAKRYNISLDDLLSANDMEEGTSLTKGMQLLIPR